MKKSFIIMALAVAATACISEISDIQPEEGQTFFTGDFLNTKILLGDKADGAYPALWEASDAIAVYNADDNTLIGTAFISEGSAGEQSGTFVLDKAIEDGTRVKVVYPATEDYAISAEQTKVSASDMHINTRAESEVIIVQDNKGSFSLTHSNAAVKVDVSSTEFSGMLLKNVSIYSAGNELSDDNDYARVTYSTPTAVSSDSPVSAVFMTLPVTTDSDFYVSVKFVDAQDNVKSVCIPKKFTGKQLMGGQVNLIKMEDLKTSDNPVAWYNPVCTRYIPEGGWAYGTSNTYVCNMTNGNEGTFDVRACGDFLDVIKYAKEPKQMQLRCGDVVQTGMAGVWTIDGTQPKKKGYASLNSYNPTITFNGDVNANNSNKNKKTAIAGFWNLCDASGNVIWSYLLWATSINEITLDNGVVMNTNLGYCPEADGGTDRAQGVYYQWGRPFPFGYGADLQTVNTNLRITSFQESAENAMSIGCTTDENNRDWWQDGTHRYDLWGNPERTETSAGGEKSIFDPCPKGWKVTSAAILKEVHDNATLDGTTYIYNGTSWPVTYFYNGDTATRGSAKGLYWADNALNDSHGLRYEFNAETKTFSGTWRANACAIRCMKDNDNR